MTLLRNGLRLVPQSVRRSVRSGREKLRLATSRRVTVDNASALRALSQQSLTHLLQASLEQAEEWARVTRTTAELGITDKADGINPGDRRALFALVSALRPKAVLEIGTHIGASTVHIAEALRPQGGASLVTVDISDVNDPTTRPWRSFGARMSPRELIGKIGMAASVRFVTASSLEYLRTTHERFDFVFLDGDHSAKTVYRELPSALRVLNPGGAILLHDYFPDLTPLWPDGRVLPGSWLAVQRLRREGARLTVLPLGDLPWATKQGTRRTSLALVVGS